jgi:hypothetical protein
MRTRSARLLPLAAGAALVLAFPGTATAGPVPDGSETRTAASTTVARTDGTRTVTLFTGPVQLRRGAEWTAVDLTLRPGDDGVIRPVAAPHDLALTPTGPVVRFADGGSAALAPVTAGPLPAPVLSGHRATYGQVAPGYDLVVEATRAGFAASVRTAGVATGPAPVLALAPSGAESVPEVAAGTDSAVSRVVAAAPPGPAPVPFDTTVQSTILRSDASGDPDLRLGSYDGVAVARSYLVWDLGEISGLPITAARLRVHQDWSSSCRPSAWEVWSVPGSVGPASRFAGQPEAERRWATSTQTRGNSAACAPGWTEVDVTELVRAWAAGGATSATMQLRAADETSPLGWKRLGSAESPHVPQLEISVG